MIVLLNGNSSVGKTTLLQNIPDKYGKYDGDEICPSILKEVIKKSIENNWFQKDSDKFYLKKIQEAMKMDINFLTIVDPKREMFFKNYKEILLYRNIKQISKNLLQRNTNIDQHNRGIFTVFNQFCRFYQTSMKKNKNYIDIINKKDIIEAISMHKYAFYNKIKMNKYIQEICKNLEINSSKNFYLEPIQKHDLVINMDNKDFQTIIQEILSII